MPAYASCKFPLIDRWKDLCDKNEALGIVDGVLSGYAQVVLNDNSFTGLLFLIITYMASPVTAFATLFCAFFAAIFARYVMRMPMILIRLGLSSVNPSLAGIAICLLVFPGQGISLAMILVCAMCSILCLIFSTGLNGFLAKWDAAAFSLPFCIVAALLLPSIINFTNLPAVHTIPAYLNVLADPAVAGSGVWTVGEFFTAVFAGYAECIFQADLVSGVLVLIAMGFASRIDMATSLLGVCTATAIAIGLGLPKGAIMAGLYGFNAVFIMLTLFGRAFRMSTRTFLFAWACSAASPFIYAGFNYLFAPLGIIVGPLPFALTCILAIVARDSFSESTFVPPLYWGVPETIEKMLREKEKDAQTAKA